MIHRYPLIALLIVPFLSGTMAYAAPGNPKVATQSPTQLATQAPRHLPDLCEMFGNYTSGDHTLHLTATDANTLTLSGSLTPTIFVKPILLLEAHAPTETTDEPTDNDETSLETDAPLKTVDAIVIEPEDAPATVLHEGTDEINSTLTINETLPLAVFNGMPNTSGQNGEIPSGYRHDLADHASLTLFRDDHGMHFIEWYQPGFRPILLEKSANNRQVVRPLQCDLDSILGLYSGVANSNHGPDMDLIEIKIYTASAFGAELVIMPSNTFPTLRLPLTDIERNGKNQQSFRLGEKGVYLQKSGRTITINTRDFYFMGELEQSL